MNQSIPELSIVIPVYNEEECLELTCLKLKEVLEIENLDYELVLVDDGSKDKSLEIMMSLAKHDSRIRFYSFSRNFGHEAATSCGLKYCRGRAAVLIDADLQDPPEVIPEMVKLWREGNDVIAGKRKSRDGESWLKKVTSFLFYRIINKFSEVSLPSDVGDFRLIDRKVINQFNDMPEKNRYVRGMFPWIGFKHQYVEYERNPRIAGATKYNYFKLIMLSFDALSSFSLAPLRLAIFTGICISILSFIAILIVLVQKLVIGIEIPGYAFLTVGVFFFGGVQMFFLGIVGEYVGKVYKEVQGRPMYIVKDEDSNE